MESLNPIDQIQIPVILAVIVIVAATYFLLRRVFFAPYVAVMEEREVRLEKGESTISEAERILAEAEPEAQGIVAAAREKADELLRRTRDEVETYRKQEIEAALQESARTLESGRAEIVSAREAEVASLREQAIECVTLACDKLIGSAEPASVEAAVDKLLARRVY
ncbi:MAG TPA: ATP synthase F0 subunit B [Coriobacteriia bacterium]